MRWTFVSRVVWVLAIAQCAGCTLDTVTDTAQQSEQETPRGAIAKADLVGSCGGAEDHCGGKSSGNCWCDDSCVSYGDCCADYDTVCENNGGGFVLSDAPHDEESCAFAGPEAGELNYATLLAGKSIPFRLAIRKRTCSHGVCSPWEEQDSLYGAPLEGSAFTSPITAQLESYWLRLEGVEGASSGKPRMLRSDCLVEMTQHTDYEFDKNTATVGCGSARVYERGSDGEWSGPLPLEAPYLSFIGFLTNECLDQTARWKSNPLSVNYVEWEGAFRTDW